MKRFVEGEDRLQGALLPHCLDDYVTENNPVRVIEAFFNELDLATLRRSSTQGGHSLRPSRGPRLGRAKNMRRADPNGKTRVRLSVDIGKADLDVLAQNGTSPQRLTSRPRSLALSSVRTIGSISVGRQVPAWREVWGRRIGRDREDQSDLADIGG